MSNCTTKPTLDAIKVRRRTSKTKRSQRTRLVLSWVRASDLLDALIDDLDTAAAAGAIDPDEAGPARRVLVSASEEMLGARPRHCTAK